MSYQQHKVPIGFLIIITALFTALVIPELFNNIVSQQTQNNQNVMQSMRIIVMVSILLIVGLCYELTIGGK